jgi:tetratricopeptide (TPR) repeat protein
MGEFDRALTYLDDGAAMARRIGDAIDLVTALGTAAQVDISLGRIDDARERYRESLAVARALGSPPQLHQALSDFATFVEAYEKDHVESLRLKQEALAIARGIDSPWAIHADQHNIACTLRMIGRVDEAHALMRSIIPDALTLRVTTNLMSIAEDYAAILAELGHHRAAARLLGAADAMHDETRMPRVAGQVAEIDAPLAKARESLPTAVWMAAYNEGRASDIEELIAQTYREIEP